MVHIINRAPDHLRHELCFLTCAGELMNRLRRPVPYHELHKKEHNDPAVPVRIAELIWRRRIDIVHTRNWAAFDGVLAALLAPRVRVIHGEHGRAIEDLDGCNPRRNRLRRWLRFRVWKFVAVSDELRNWLNQRVGIPEHSLVYIPNGVDAGHFRPARDPELRRDLGIGEHEFVVGAVGRLDPVKNHESLIEAAALLNSEGIAVRVVIVGDGPAREKVQAAARSASLALPPLFVGYQPDPSRFYRIFNAFVLPSLAEGMANTLLEAMASGLPAVCTSVGGNRELVRDGETGRQVPAGDSAALARALREYCENPEECRRHGERARALVEREYSLGSMVSRYTSLYESCIFRRHTHRSREQLPGMETQTGVAGSSRVRNR